jgi:cytochrome c peroxidase
MRNSNEGALARSKLVPRRLLTKLLKKGTLSLGSSLYIRIAWSKLAAIGIAMALSLVAFGHSPTRKEPSAQIRLGLRLFREARFSSPQGDLQNSCASCHVLDEDPQGMRAHADFFSRSWVPWRGADPRREELRNSPTILDAALMPRLHFDGEFGSLEDLVKGTLAGRPMGWLPGEQDQAFDRVYGIILKDTGEGSDYAGNYRADFKAAYGVDPGDLGKAEVIDRAAKAIADYMRTLKTGRTTPYDRFVQANGLNTRPAQGEAPKVFARRLLGNVVALEKKRALKLSGGFGPAAVKGLKVFLRTNGAGSTGNCVACHTPPLFTDFSFHNMGISQSEYDQVNGDGSFAELQIPAAEAQRPSTQFREIPSKRKPGCADLGHWNFVDLKSSPLRRAGESDDQFLQRMIAAFKTPTLRNLAFTQPYMHTGGFSTIETALAELMRLSELARAGKVREGDEELAKIRITDADIPSLAAFLKTLNEDLRPGGKY